MSPQNYKKYVYIIYILTPFLAGLEETPKNLGDGEATDRSTLSYTPGIRKQVTDRSFLHMLLPKPAVNFNCIQATGSFKLICNSS